MENKEHFETVSKKIKATLDDINEMAKTINDRLDRIIVNLDIMIDKDEKSTNKQE